MVPFLLYLSTGIITLIPVWYQLSWAVWGAPISPLEFVSLLGSILFVVAAFTSLSDRRSAARRASIAAVAVWSFYLPAIVTTVNIHSSDQELTLSVYLWTPAASPLAIRQPKLTSNSPDMASLRTEIQQIEKTGITGSISVFHSPSSRFTRYGSGKKSHVTLIIQRPVTRPVELREPDATSVVYVQQADGWKMFPHNAHTLERTIRLEPLSDVPDQTDLTVELADGSREGFGVWWPDARSQSAGK
jgi:hypothetical protein